MSATLPFRPCALVPTYDNPRTVQSVVRALRKHLDTVIVVDDGSREPGREAVDALAGEGGVQVVRHPHNQGKGVAVRSGFAAARRLGFSHALQVDADGQHELGDVPRLLEAARTAPDALVLGEPIFDASQPLHRFYARKISIGWVHVETGGRRIHDPMCGFRVYPIESALAAAARGDRMEFDLEIPVRMVWNGVQMLHVPTRVRYLPAAEGGVSHFRAGEDNLRIAWLHTRLVAQAPVRLWKLRQQRRARGEHRA